MKDWNWRVTLTYGGYVVAVIYTYATTESDAIERAARSCVSKHDHAVAELRSFCFEEDDSNV